MKEIFEGYQLTSKCKRTLDGRYSVGVLIEKSVNNAHYKEKYTDTKINLILEIEAEKEAINFGKSLIKKRMISF